MFSQMVGGLLILLSLVPGCDRAPRPSYRNTNLFGHLGHSRLRGSRQTAPTDETVRGILNLKREHQRVEVRVVIHKQTYRGLPRLAEFLARNLLFVINNYQLSLNGRLR